MTGLGEVVSMGCSKHSRILCVFMDKMSVLKLLFPNFCPDVQHFRICQIYRPSHFHDRPKIAVCARAPVTNRLTVFPIYRARAVNEQCKFFTNRMDSLQRSYLLSLTKTYMGLEWLTPSLTEMVNMVIIIPATHQHVSIFSVSMAAC